MMIPRVLLRAVLAASTGLAGRAAAVEPARTVVPPAVAYAAVPLPLSAVRLTGGPLKAAQDADRAYLLRLEPDRMLALFRERAGLAAKAKPYGGWDGPGRQLTGHIAGHYLSAVSLMYAATGDDRFKQRADDLVDGLKAVQDARGTGYVGALLGHAERRGNAAAGAADTPLLDGELLFDRLADGRVESGGFDLNGMWSPWYVQHKIFAGLRDAYRFAGNKAALDVEIKFAAWCEGLLAGLSDAQTQKMLDTEFGGMNEVLTDLYADTGEQRWLTLARKFDHRAIVGPLAAGRDDLAGKHGNTQIPKLIGALAEYLYTADPAAGAAARTFWDSVTAHHSFATGGHGYDEYFGPPDQLSGEIDGTGQRSRSLRTAESCNVYNMLKLTRRLFALSPEPRYAEFIERALFNHVLSSIDPADGRTCYMVPVGPGVAREYQDPFQSFTCCVGTGMENHALHGDGLYYAGGGTLWVTTYAPSTADWPAAGGRLTVDTDMPLGRAATLRLSLNSPRRLSIAFRRPAWAGDGFSIGINHEPADVQSRPGAFVTIEREWRDGDTVTLTLPHTLRTEALADNPSRVAILWGPLVLAGDFGPQTGDDPGRRTFVDFPVFPNADRPLVDWLKPVDGAAPGTFRATTAQGRVVTLSPFYTLQNRRYDLYWDLFTPGQWADRQAAYAAEQARMKAQAEATVAFVQFGQMQPERDFNFRHDGTNVIRRDGQPGRRGGRWMSVDVAVDPASAASVAVTTLADTPADGLAVSVDGVDLAGPTTRAEAGSAFADRTYAVPPGATAGKRRVTVRLAAPAGKELPSVFGLRVLRAGADGK